MANSAIERYRRDEVKRATGLLTIKDYHRAGKDAWAKFVI